MHTLTRRCSCGTLTTCPAPWFTCLHCDRPCLDTAKGCKQCDAINLKTSPA